jgi:diguanylate cyclase (GGDEF)-like protein/PAS domain S-box-containing protein
MFMYLPRLAVLLAFVLLSLPFGANGQQVNILVVAINGVEKAETEWRPTIEFLGNSLPQYNFKLIPVIPSELDKIRLLIQQNRIDFVISQPAIYVDLEIKFGVSRILTMINSDGYAQFGSVIITRADSDIYSIHDLQDKSIAGVSAMGFGGWLVGYQEMLNNGFNPLKDAARVKFLGTQPRQVKAVLDGRVDAAVIRTGVLEKLSSQGEISMLDFRVLAAKSYADFDLMVSTALYPEWAFAKTHRVSNTLAKEVALAMLSLTSDDSAAQKGGYGQWTFPYDYQPVHNLLKSLKTGPYLNFGRVSLIEILIEHWPGVLAFIILTLSFFSIILLWNRKLQREVEVRKKIEQTLRDNEQNLLLAASVFAHTNEGIVITDPQAKILDINESFTRISGFYREEVVGKNPRFLQSGYQDASFYQNMWQALKDKGHWAGVIWNRHKNNQFYAEKLSINAVENERGQVQHYVGIFSDITHQVSQQQHMEHLAYHDALTDLPNRLLLTDRLEQAMIQARRQDGKLAVVYLDLDGFKEINDSHGHEMGDQLLVSISTRLQKILREGDTIARIGGDEFVIVLEDITSRSGCLRLLKRMLMVAAQPVNIGDRALQVSASLGITIYPQVDSIDAEQLLHQADQAMYQAKLAGKNCYKIFNFEQLSD